MSPLSPDLANGLTHERRPAMRLIWEGLALVALLNIPSLVWLRVPLWQLPPGLRFGIPLLALGYGLGSWPAVSLARPAWARIAVSGVTMIIGAGFVVAFHLLATDLLFSRGLALLTLGIGGWLLVARDVASRPIRLATGLGLVAALAWVNSRWERRR